MTCSPENVHRIVDNHLKQSKPTITSVLTSCKWRGSSLGNGGPLGFLGKALLVSSEIIIIYVHRNRDEKV